MKTAMTCTELRQRMESGSVVVFDVLTPEDHAACHIIGAHSACVYEIVFLDLVAKHVSDHGMPIVVYDYTGTTRTSEIARKKLILAGYQSVYLLSGGLSAWRSAAYPVEGNNPAGFAETSLHDGTYAIELEKSRIEWIGRNLSNRHYGHIAIAGGELIVRNGFPAEARVVLDMSSITDLDLQDDSLRELLTWHLKSDDFFAVDRFPTAVFELSGWKPLTNAIPGAPNCIVTGSLTIKDIRRAANFPALISPQEDGSVRAHVSFEIDRTLWNVLYGSGKLFERLGMHLVHDLISLELFITAK
jgi:rhodanese-related sulfurtransferase